MAQRKKSGSGVRWVQKHRKGYRGWVTLHGRRVFLQTRNSAEEAYADALAARSKGGKLAKATQGRFSLAQGMDLVLEQSRTAGLRPATLAHYLRHFKVMGKAWSEPGAIYGEEGWATIPLSNLDEQEINWFISRRRKQGVSASTIRHDLVALGRVIKLARKKGYIDRDPMELVDKPKVEQAAPRPFSRSELVTVLDFLRSGEPKVHRANPADDADLIEFLFATGLRRTELAHLCGGDIDLPARVVHVRHAKRTPRQFPICDEAEELFAAMRSWAEWSEPEDWIVPGTKLEHRQDYIQRTFDRWRRFFTKHPTAIDVENVPDRLHPHNMRHTLGSHLGACGQTEGTIAALLGHQTSATVTRRYVTAFSPELRAAAALAWRSVR